MKRSLLAWMAALFAAASANALATLDLTAIGTPTPGAVITLEVRVSVTPADGTDGSLFAGLLYPNAVFGSLNPTPGLTQFAFPSDGDPFGLGALTCTSTRCVMFNQVAGVQGPQTGNVTNFLISQQILTIPLATPVGTVITWNWQTTPSASSVSFYNAVPSVPALEVTVVPEPTTAALLGLGLLALAGATRRRR